MGGPHSESTALARNPLPSLGRPFIMVVNGQLAHPLGLDSFQHCPHHQTTRFHIASTHDQALLIILLISYFLMFSTSQSIPFAYLIGWPASFVSPYLLAPRLAFVTRPRLDRSTSVFGVEKRKHSSQGRFAASTRSFSTASNTASPKLNVDQARRFQCCIVIVRPGRPACPTAKTPHPPFSGSRLGGADNLLAAVQHVEPAANWSATQP